MKRFLWLHIVLLCCRYLVNSEAKHKYVKMNAGKFLVGYILGLPVARFNKYVCMYACIVVYMCEYLYIVLYVYIISLG